MNKEELVSALREVIPEDINTRFEASDTFFDEFENFKAPLLGYLAAQAEINLRAATEDLSEELLRGFLSGVIFTVWNIANVRVIEDESEG